MNGKGGMNNKEFKHYFDNSIVPLFPDLEDMPGKCILLKFDSSRSCDWRDLLTFTPGCPTIPICSKRGTLTSMVHSRVLFGGTSKDCDDMLRQRDHNVPRNFHVWVDCLQWSLT
jgi:hypothetical protein